MSIALRVSLIIVSILCCAFMLSNIRKSRIKIEDSIFWIGFSILLIALSAFPRLVFWGSELTGVQSPANFVFLVVIFLLIIKLFKLTIKVSKLESKLQTLIQTIAIDENRKYNDNKETGKR